MDDDLIERLREPWCIADDMLELMSEAADTIARQQEMLDRALESNGDMMVRIGKLEAQAGSIVPVIRALEAWYDVVRNGRTIEPSLMGMADMIGILSASAAPALNRAAPKTPDTPE